MLDEINVKTFTKTHFNKSCGKAKNKYYNPYTQEVQIIEAYFVSEGPSLKNGGLSLDQSLFTDRHPESDLVFWIWCLHRKQKSFTVVNHICDRRTRVSQVWLWENCCWW